MNIHVTPAEIARSVYECKEHTSSGQELGDANVCLRIYGSPKNRLGESSLAQDNLIPGVLQLRTAVSCRALLPTWRIPGSLSPPHPLLSPIGDLQSSVTFDLTLDPGRLNPRAIFKETSSRSLTRVRVLGLGRHCEDVKLLLPVRGSGSPGDGGDSEVGSGLGGERTRCALVLVLAQHQQGTLCAGGV